MITIVQWMKSILNQVPINTPFVCLQMCLRTIWWHSASKFTSCHCKHKNWKLWITLPVLLFFINTHAAHSLYSFALIIFFKAKKKYIYIFCCLTYDSPYVLDKNKMIADSSACQAKWFTAALEDANLIQQWYNKNWGGAGRRK